MNVLVTGGTGYLGRGLCQRLLADKNNVFVLTRSLKRAARLCPGTTAVSELNKLNEHKIDLIYNFAGAPIATGRWSPKRKQELLASRITLTQDLFTYFQSRDQHPHTVVSASAIGFYGDQGDRAVTEESAGHDEFTHQLCRDWENSAQAFAALGSQVCCLRLGVVIGKNSGFLKQLYWPYFFGMGGGWAVVSNGCLG